MYTHFGGLFMFHWKSFFQGSDLLFVSGLLPDVFRFLL